MNYYLMNKDNPVLEMAIKNNHAKIVKIFDNSYFPYGYNMKEDFAIDEWLKSRKIAEHRDKVKELINKSGCGTHEGLIRYTACASLNDSFWVKNTSDNISWSDVSLYSNSFNEVIARIAFDDENIHEDTFFGNNTRTPEYGTDGMYGKRWLRQEDGIYLKKKGLAGASNVGLEPYSEVLSSKLAIETGLDAVPYDILEENGRASSLCKLVTSEDVGFVKIRDYMISKGINNPALKDMQATYESLGFEHFFNQMVNYDAIILNEDRHLGNHGFLVNNDTGEIIKPMPLFDHNLTNLPYVSVDDDYRSYIAERQPKIGNNFVDVASFCTDEKVKKWLRDISGYRYETLGNYPEWKLDLINNVKNLQVALIAGDYENSNKYRKRIENLNRYIDSSVATREQSKKTVYSITEAIQDGFTEDKIKNVLNNLNKDGSLSTIYEDVLTDMKELIKAGKNTDDIKEILSHTNLSAEHKKMLLIIADDAKTDIEQETSVKTDSETQKKTIKEQAKAMFENNGRRQRKSNKQNLKI